jgi:hypothetical protein
MDIFCAKGAIMVSMQNKTMQNHIDDHYSCGYYKIIDLAKGDGVERGAGVEWQPSDYLGRVPSDIIFGGRYPASVCHITVYIYIYIYPYEYIHNDFQPLHTHHILRQQAAKKSIIFLQSYKNTQNQI